MSEVKLGDWPLPLLHQSLLHLVLPDQQIDVVDGSDWFARFPGGPREYYLNIFIGLTGGTVLFEQFDTNKEEAEFFARIVRPAFEEAASILGHDPPILPLCRGKHAASPLWYSYPDSYRAHFYAMGVEP